MPLPYPRASRLSALALAAGLALAGAWPRPALAADLLAAWAGAEQHDRELAVARAARAGAQPLREQAAALWRPGVQFTASAGIASSDSDMRGAQFAAPGLGSSSGADFATSIHGGTAARWALQASQPLYHPLRRAQQRQLGLQADMAELRWQAALQQAMLRTVQRCLDVAVAQQALQVTGQQLAAVQRALEEAEERFRIGDAPVTDTHEARSRLAALRAQQVAAQVELSVRRRLLADSTGLPPEALPAGLPAAAVTAPLPLPLAHWLQQADDGNPGIRLEQLAELVARAEVDKHGAGAAPSVELIAQAGQERLHGSGDFGRARNAASSALLGVQLTVPLYSGGMRNAKQSQALRQLEQARAQLAHTRQQVASQVHAAWLGLTAGAQRVQALAQALQASQSRLDATRTGREAGDRTLLDLLGAQSDAATAELALAQARSALMLDELRLALLAGVLDEQRLRTASQALAAAQGPLPSPKGDE